MDNNIGYQYAATVLHRGIVFVFTASADPASDDIYYNVLDLEIASSDDALDWSGFNKLDFPKELRTVGMGMVTVPMAEDTTGGVSHGQFKVLSDQKYLYVFRRSNRNTLYCNRYSMTEARGERDSDQTVRTLEPAWEVRFQRSGKRDIPASDRDITSYKSPMGDYFVEPTLELSMVENIDDGGFSVLLVPSQTGDSPRWQIFSHDSKAGCISMFSFARDDSGLFDVAGKSVDSARKTILPDRQFTLSRDDDASVPMDVVTGLSATVYYKQEPATGADGKSVGLKRSGRVLLAAGVLPRGAAADERSTATIDFAIARDGTLAQIEKQTVLGEVEPAGHTLYFGDGSSIDLTDNQNALSLAGSFTLEAWVQPDGIDDVTRVVLGGSQSAPASDTAPFIRVVNGFVETGFAGVMLATPVSVLQSGVWNQVAVTFDTSSGALTVYVNGALIVSKAFQGQRPPGKPVSIMGAAATAALPPFHGGLDEVRIWNSARTQAQIIATLYTEIEDPTQQSELVGYWAFDHVVHSGGTITVPDLSRFGNAGTLHGPQVQATTSPVEAATSAKLQIDANGLTVEAGYLPFVKPASTPFLLDGSDGLVHLYFQSTENVFSVAQYDAAIARAIYYVPWATQGATPTDGQAQAMALVAHRAGTLMNGCAVAVTPATVAIGSATGTRADLCRLDMATRTNANETWRGVPRSLSRCIDVLTGHASGDPSDPRLKSGQTHFFDYRGIHRTSWLEAPGGHVLIATRRPAQVAEEIVDPDGLDVASVAIVQTSAGLPATLTMRFAPADGGAAIEQIWPGVPLDIETFTSILTGLSNSYPYEAINTGMPIYSLSAGASRLLLLARTTAITRAKLKVTPGTTAVTCDLTVELVVDGETLSFEAKQVKRLQNDVAQALRACTTAGGQKLTDTLFVTCDGLDSDVADQERVYEGTTDGLRAATALFSLIVDGASGEVAAKTFDALLLQSATSNDPNADLREGSALFGAAAASLPANGQTAMLQDTAEAALWQPVVDGGWLAEPQRFAVAFNSNAAVVDLSDKTKAQPLHIRGDLTMEAWVDPTGTASSACPRIVSYNHTGDAKVPDDYARYMLGCLESKYLQITASNASGTRIDLADAAGAFGPGAYTVQTWLQPNLATIDANAQWLWSRMSASGMERLSLDQAGKLIFVVQAGGKTNTVIGETALPSQTWTHVSVVRDDNAVTLYVDGRPCGTGTVDAKPEPATQFFVAGNSGQGYLIQFGMNEMRIWSRALGAGEIAANMNAQLPNDADGLRLRWPLSSDADGDVARNTAQTGSVYDGRISNTRTWRQPGVFYTAYAGSRRKAVRSSAAVVPRANWTHLAAVYDTANALQFSDAAYGNAGNDASFDFDQDFGIDLWVTPDTAGAARPEALVSKWGDQPDGRSWELGIAKHGRPYMRVRLVSGKEPLDVTAFAAVPILSGAPHHIAATLDLTVETKVVTGGTANVPATADAPGDIESWQVITVTVFVDGKRAGSEQRRIKNGQYALTRSSTDVQLARTCPDATGTNAPYLQASYSGAMSNVRLWAKALTEADAATLSRPEAAVSTDGLVAWWPFSEMTGTVAFDQAGNNNVALTVNDMWRLYDANAALRLYVNGDLVPADEALPETFGGYGESQLRLGGMRADNAFAQGWTGTVDEIRLWNTNLTQEQITDSMSRPLAGNEDHLAGYWRFDAGSGLTVADWTGRGNDAVLEQSGTGILPAWVVSTAPVNNEGPAVHNVLGGLKTQEAAHVTSSPVAVDYPDVQRDATGQMFSVIKRLYVAPLDRRIGLLTGFKLGDLDTTYVGQVQTNPKLIGYIEGAPPLPSENQSRPLYADPRFSDFLYYEQASKVTIEQEEESVRAYSSTKQSGFDLDTEVKAGLYMINQVKGGSPFLHADMVDLEGHIGLHATFAFSTSTETGQDMQGNRTRTFTNAISCGGEWEEQGPPAPNNPDGWLNPLVGRRFMPDNTGFALVKSLTADMYAQTLKTTGALVALTLVPNQEIPEDVNILTFPIQPRYTKNGTLDGKVGLVNDPSYLDANLERGSYFKPVEAYAQKRRIERQSRQLEAYWDQFDATSRGQSGNAGLDQVRDDDPYYNWKAGVSRKGMVNSYVWSAGGGLYKDEEQYGTTYGESHSGSYEFKGMAGLIGDGMGAFFGMGFYAEVDFLVGGHLEVTVLKKSEDSRSFGLDVELDADSFLKRYLGDNSPVAYSKGNCPGKVDGYRFMTFYLPPDSSNAEHFQKVVDEVWLARSDEPAAVSLRQLAFDENGVWRIFHRVTYVSRVPPEFQPVPDESQAPPVREPANVDDNLELIRLVQQALGKDEPTPLNIGKAVNTVLDTTLVTTLPWWGAFLQAAKAFQSDAQKTLQALRADLLAYMNEAYATVLKDKPHP